MSWARICHNVSKTKKVRFTVANQNTYLIGVLFRTKWETQICFLLSFIPEMTWPNVIRMATVNRVQAGHCCKSPQIRVFCIIGTIQWISHNIRNGIIVYTHEFANWWIDACIIHSYFGLIPYRHRDVTDAHTNIISILRTNADLVLKQVA